MLDSVVRETPMPRCLRLAVALALVLGAGCGRDDPAPAPPAMGKDVWIVAAPPERMVMIIKVVREVTGLGLKDAKDLVDGAPRLVKSSGDRAEAEALAKALRNAGATVEIR
jgi:large subunit ribosomal protein L7/L12